MGSKMKILLTKSVEKLGAAGDVREVSGGYGRNYLIPQGYAVIATPGQVKQAAQLQAAVRKREDLARKDAQSLADRLNGKTFRFVERVGELDRLYGSVTSQDINGKIEELLGTSFDRRKIELGESIKRTGVYAVSVRLMSGVEAVLNVVVEGEEGSIQLPDDPNAEA